MRALYVAVLIVVLATARSARSSSPAFYWCGGLTIQHSDEAYYSDAFESGASTVDISSAWNNYMKANYNLTPLGGCTTYSSYQGVSDARSARDKDAGFYRGLGKKVIMTNWTY